MTSSIFQCTVCRSVLPAASQSTTPASQCPNCKTDFPNREGYTDMTASSEGQGSTSLLPSTSTPSREGVFQLPQVSYAYERGWRSQFKRAGFPGPTEEARLALEYLTSSDGDVNNDNLIIDLSCGSGIITRQLVEQQPENRIWKVIACDLSHSMLMEADSQISNTENNNILSDNISFIRLSVNKLPFHDDCLQAIHSSAAIHCWPDLKVALSEIYRCLKPSGGKFFASTFLKAPYWPRGSGILGQSAKFAVPIIDKIQSFIPISNNYQFYDKEDLVCACRSVGFDDVDVEERGGCAIIRSCKGRPLNTSEN